MNLEKNEIKITGTDRKKVKKKRTDTKTPKLAFFLSKCPNTKNSKLSILNIIIILVLL